MRTATYSALRLTLVATSLYRDRLSQLVAVRGGLLLPTVGPLCGKWVRGLLDAGAIGRARGRDGQQCADPHAVLGSTIVTDPLCDTGRMACRTIWSREAVHCGVGRLAHRDSARGEIGKDGDPLHGILGSGGRILGIDAVGQDAEEDGERQKPQWRSVPRRWCGATASHSPWSDHRPPVPQCSPNSLRPAGERHRARLP